MDRTAIPGYLNPAHLGHAETIDLLTQEGEHEEIRLAEVKCVHFVRDFQDSPEPERKTFLSRPKLDGLWVKLRFRDDEVMEGIISNDLVGMMESGIQLTPPDLHGNSLRMFIPRTALIEMKVLGVVGVARRVPRETRPAAEPRQEKLFGE